MSCCKSQACRLGEFASENTANLRYSKTKNEEFVPGDWRFGILLAMVYLASQNPAPHRGFRHLGRASCAPRRARDTGKARHDRSPDTQSVVHSECAAKA